MSFSINSATQKISTQISDTILNYLGKEDIPLQVSKKRSREDSPSPELFPHWASFSWSQKKEDEHLPKSDDSPSQRAISNRKLLEKREEVVQEFFLQYICTKDSYLHYDTHIKYDEFDSSDLTRYVERNQRWAFNSPHISASKINAFILKLQSKGGIAEIAADLDNYKEYPRYALIALLRRGDLCKAQFVSLCLLCAAIEQLIKNRKMVMSYEFPGLIPTSLTAHNYIMELPSSSVVPELRTYSVYENKVFIQKFFNLSHYGTELLLSRLKSKPDSEHHYHTIQLPLGPVHSWSPGHHRVMHSINLLHPVTVGESDLFSTAQRSVMVIPSFSMFQEYMKEIYEDRAIPLAPILGTCTKGTITHFKLQDLRPFHVGMEQIRVPNEADNNYFGPYSYTLHDFYHAVRDAFLEKGTRRAVCHIVERILHRSINEKTEDIRWKLMDGELSRQDKQHFGHIFSSTKFDWDDAHKRAILTDMAALSTFWQSEFGIAPEMLLEPERAIYDSILPTITQAKRERAQFDLFHYYKRSARDNDPFAQYRLGNMYYDGIGTKVSYPDAIKHWQLSGQDRALYQIGLCYKEGIGVEASPKEAFNYFLKAAKTNPSAQFRVGCSYYFGEKGVVEKNARRGVYYFTKAAEQGHYSSQLNLGVAHRDGEGVEIDLRKSFDYFQRAAAAGDPSALAEVGICYFRGEPGVVEQDFSKALIHFNKAEEQREPNAFLYLGIMHRDGKGVDKDLAKALDYFKKGADAGNADCQAELGFWHSHGKEDLIKKDITKAIDYFDQAAKQENRIALLNLGIAYNLGQGVEKDKRKAFDYFKRAARAGLSSAQFEVGLWYYKGEKGVVQKDFREAFSYFKMAAAQGHIEAHHNVGVMYKYGQGVEIDLKKAFEHFLKAADEGDGDSQNQIGVFYTNGEEGVVEKNTNKAIEYFERAAKQGLASAQSNLKIVKEQDTEDVPSIR